MAEVKTTNRVNVGTRSKAEDAAALDKLKAEALAEQGKKIVDEEGRTFIVEKNAFGMTIKTRIA